ncbi:MAG: sulfur carrier protein ThiS [Bacteroidales bacterium]|nr:sulfur carrier protein ThiS [Bacteroidales bacterium]
MNVIVNGEPTSIKGSTVAELAAELNLPDKGVAIARGTQMIPRQDWASTTLSEGDSLIIIRAACGG